MEKVPVWNRAFCVSLTKLDFARLIREFTQQNGKPRIERDCPGMFKYHTTYTWPGINLSLSTFRWKLADNGARFNFAGLLTEL